MATVNVRKRSSKKAAAAISTDTRIDNRTKRWRAVYNSHTHRETVQFKISKMATDSEPRKKRARHGFRYQMELYFASEDAKQAFLSRMGRLLALSATGQS